jgi:protein-disulfide isomerase
MRSLLTWVALACSAAACGNAQANRVEGPNSKQIDELSDRLDDMDTRLKKIELLLANALEEPQEPDPNVVYAVPIAGDPHSGPEHAKVTLVEAFEFACPYCFEARPLLEQLRKDYGGDLKVVYKYYVVHQSAVIPGLAWCAADRQGKFAEMGELIWLKGFQKGDLGADLMEALASELGLDMDRYRADLDSDACKEFLKRNYIELNTLGVNGTPVFYVNGRYLSGVQPIGNFKKLIDEELAKANKAIGAGTPLESLYQKEILGKGQKKL